MLGSISEMQGDGGHDDEELFAIYDGFNDRRDGALRSDGNGKVRQ